MLTQSHHVARILFAATVAMSAAAVLAQPASSPATHVFAASKPIPGRYIVVLKASVSDPDAESFNLTRQHGGQVHRTYGRALKGFTATLSDAALQGMRNNPNVDYIEQDQTVSLNLVQDPATWGLDRIDEPDLSTAVNQYNYNYTGAGVHAFIIDTGIRLDHAEFTGRLLPGHNVIGTDPNATDDCNGHGTHVAGTVGGSTWGVAKAVSLIPVRVLDCAGSGTWSGVIAGIDWVARSPLRPAVANMSLGGGKSTAVNSAVASAVSQGVTMVVAAGNSNANACNYSPASEPSAITVGATTSSDARASYSNYGSCVDIFAPGSAITSAWNTGTNATAILSGTSMASPHVAGVAALALAVNPTVSPAVSPAAVTSFLTSNATPGKISSVGTGSPNLLVYSLASGAPTAPAITTVAVKSLTGTSARSGTNWRASVTTTIGDPTNNFAVVANATVSGSFSPGGTASCVTSSTGSCTMNSAVISRSTSVTVMTVTNVSGTNLTYNSGQNLASKISVARP